MRDFVGIQLPHPYLVDPGAQAPLGLLYVVGGAAQAGFTVGVHDGTGQTAETLAATIEPARVYGISATVVDYDMACSVAKALRHAHPGCCTLLGGPIHTADGHASFSDFDSVVKGNADAAIADILTDVFSTRLKARYDVTCTDLEHVRNPYQHWKGMLGGKVLSASEHRGKQSAVLITSRGCPGRCCFCCARRLCGGRVRFRDMDAVFQDVDYLVSRGVRVLRLSDENFTVRPSRVVEWCERIRPYYEEKGVVWRPSFRVDFNDPKVHRLMRASGCVEASVGVESADQAVLDAMRKDATVEDARSCLASLGQVGITRRALFMVGCPGTSTQTIRKNVQFMLDQQYEIMSMTVFAPLPGTDIWEQPESYRCDIMPHARKLDNLCFFFYGPDGVREFEPFISLWDFDYDSLRADVNLTRALGKALNVVNTG